MGVRDQRYGREGRALHVVIVPEVQSVWGNREPPARKRTELVSLPETRRVSKMCSVWQEQAGRQATTRHLGGGGDLFKAVNN